MSETPSQSRNSSAPWLHGTGDASQTEGASLRLKNQLDDWQAELSTFADEMSQELKGILSVLSPSKSISGANSTSSRPVGNGDNNGDDHVESPPASPVTVPTVEEAVTIPVSSVKDDQSRLSALKARLAERLREETGSSAFTFDEGRTHETV